MDFPIKLGPRYSTRLYWLACLVMLVAAAALRFYNLGSNSLWLDEAIAANNSQGTFFEVVLYTRHRNSSPALYPYMLWVIQLIDKSAISVRFIPALASTLTVAVFLFLLPRVGVRPQVAFFAGLIATFSIGALQVARDVREYGVDALVAALLIVAMLLYLKNGKKTALCLALFIAPLLQYGLVLFSSAILATVVVVLMRRGGDNPPRSIRQVSWDLRFPFAAFAIGCTISLITLSGQWNGSSWAVDGYLAESYYHGVLYDLPAIIKFLVAQIWLAISSQV